MCCWPEQDQLVVHASKNPYTFSNPYPPTRILNWPYVRKRLSYGDRMQVFLISIPRHLSLSIRTFSNLTTLAWSSCISKVISRRAEDDIPPISPSALIFFNATILFPCSRSMALKTIPYAPNKIWVMIWIPKWNIDTSTRFARLTFSKYRRGRRLPSSWLN